MSRISQLTDQDKRNIELNGKNLIIVGNNGSGKTLFLRALNECLSEIFRNQYVTTIGQLKKTLNEQVSVAKQLQVDTDGYNNVMNSVSILNEFLEKKKKFDVVFASTTDIANRLRKKQF
ncbi:TPA: hypothetical protein MHK35_24530, partial [Klebsiella pneumoniae]|nr:hypothetical protein [Klebsiella pneumoniae]